MNLDNDNVVIYIGAVGGVDRRLGSNRKNPCSAWSSWPFRPSRRNAPPP